MDGCVALMNFKKVTRTAVRAATCQRGLAKKFLNLGRHQHQSMGGTVIVRGTVTAASTVTRDRREPVS
jgi:hypothetical protein